MTDSVGDPALIGGRAYVRPFGDTLFLRGWAVGATVVTDRTAPRHYVNAGGTTVPVLQQDDKGNPLVASDSVFAGGVDTEFELLHNSIISLIPYVDLNRIAGAGNGLHAGILTDIYLPVPILDINVQARLEYRMSGADRVEYRLRAWKFTRARGRDGFVIHAPDSLQVVDLP